MQKKKFGGLSDSFSRLIIPFYLKTTYRGGEEVLFSARNWTAYERKTVYLTKYIQEIFDAQKNVICSFYRLKDNARYEAGLQRRETPLHVVSKIMRGRCEEYIFTIDDIWAAYFATGIGFLMLDISHGNEENLQQITDKCFALANIFSARVIKETNELNLRFFYKVDDKEIDCTLGEALRDILQEDALQGAMQIFPTSTRSRLCSFHRIIRKEKREGDEAFIRRLNRGIHSTAFVQEENYDFLESEFDFHVTRSSAWYTCSNGAVSLIDDDADNHEFLTNVYPKNVENDYFQVFLLVLHEREILLWYNYQIVQNWDCPQKLIVLREELIQFKLWFSYNTVSIEMAYQNFYECLYKAFKLEKLENDVEDVIDKVHEFVTSKKDRKLNGMLAVVTVLAVVSVFGDTLGLIDRFYMPEYPFRFPHVIAIIFLGVVIAGSLLFCFKGTRRRRNKKKKK